MFLAYQQPVRPEISRKQTKAIVHNECTYLLYSASVAQKGTRSSKCTVLHTSPVVSQTSECTCLAKLYQPKLAYNDRQAHHLSAAC